MSNTFVEMKLNKYKNDIYAKYDNSALEKHLDVKNILKAFNKIHNAKNVFIIGDYDVDGFTSTAMMGKMVKLIAGERNVKTFIPSRYDGYNEINFSIVKQALSKYDLIIHVDNGTDADYINDIIKNNAQSRFLIIDHHPNEVLKKEMDFVINPNKDGKVSTSTGLIIGHMYNILYAYSKKVPEAVNGEIEKDMLDDLVAISAIADMASKDSPYNRKQIYKGLNKIKYFDKPIYKGKNENDIFNWLSFELIPKLNSLGRIAVTKDINDIDFQTLFFSEDKKAFKEQFKKIEAFNNLRKKATNLFSQMALNEYYKTDKINSVFVYMHENIPIGVNGLVAQKVFQSTGTPAISLSPNPYEPDIYYGSGRGTDLKHILEEFKNSTDIDFSFGGHIEALGVQVKREDVERFVKELNQFVSQRLELEKDITLVCKKGSSIQEVINYAGVYQDICNNIPFDKDFYIPLKAGDIAIKNKYNDFYAEVEIDGIKALGSPDDVEKALLKNSDEVILMKLPYNKENISFELKTVPKNKLQLRNELDIENPFEKTAQRKMK